MSQPSTDRAAVTPPLIEVSGVSKFFGSVVALKDISMRVRAGEVMCLLGDNGAGKSTLIKILSGVHRPSEGTLKVEGRAVTFASPKDALDAGIATVHQHLAIQPLMSVARNFFMGREPTRGWGPFRRFDLAFAERTVREEMLKMGIDIRDPSQAVGTMSGGERQCVAIARAVYFGAKVLILDEPTSALGVKQAGVVLRYIAQAKARGLGVVFITHNVHHAYPVADAFTILKRGRSYGTFRKADVTREQVLEMMAGGQELDALEAELKEFARSDAHGSDMGVVALAAAVREERDALH
ncbi:ATP-binding cassette domain-containing protein [Truepera radiovictrix]|uniref:ABC transporter related protein n=1 Tax=Truepera radiovictrix (strain DSM 17093 / CIP 108686 / LMG 22925 / RQ-24) TaxID=649638 RepID=D7CWF8_TRURR|nr:ATP-binding cassette domain-containing protein [Truepera radiovictrix]ADI14357.1 ABC transporter related protein [Truepera radiovictrix DSM 17093]WMT57086.1 ATP-binding cassette domain-containing protein [Truepera radiovictrix]